MYYTCTCFSYNIESFVITADCSEIKPVTHHYLSFSSYIDQYSNCMVDNMHDVIIYKLVKHTDYSIERKQTCIMEYSYDTILSSGPACSNSITICKSYSTILKNCRTLYTVQCTSLYNSRIRC